MIQQLIRDEKLVNIHKAQAGLARLLVKAEKTATFYRVIRNDESLGVLLPQNLWDSFVEDIEALSSVTYRTRITKARHAEKKLSAHEVKKQLGI